MERVAWLQHAPSVWHVRCLTNELGFATAADDNAEARMFEGRRKDRRAGYSFRAHVRRVVETKGFTHVALTLGATAIVAGTAFANCSSSDITGPSSDPPRMTLEPAPVTSPTSSTEGTATTQSTITTKQPAPFKMPFAALPPNNPCTGEPVVWDHGTTMMQGTAQTSTGLDGRMHVQFHLNASGQGVSGASATRARKYSGSQEYNSQSFTVLADQTERYKFEWNVKVIARGESGALAPEDDFMLHVVATMGPAPNFFPEALSATAPPGECH